MVDLNQYIGVPFKRRGLTPKGWNCWGLCVWVGREEYGIKFPGYEQDYEDAKDFETIAQLVFNERELQDYWQDIPEGEEQPGDIITLRLRGEPIHLGLVIGGNQMLHVYEGIETVTERYTGQLWKNRIIGFSRYVG